MIEESEAYLYLADVGDVPNGQMKCIDLEGRKILLAHVGENFHAVEDACSHAQADLSSGRLRMSGKVVCPIHGATFDLTTGEALSPPAVLPIAAFPMKVEDDKIYIKLVPTPKPPKNPFAIPGM